MIKLSASVGVNGTNKPNEVKKVKEKLRGHFARARHLRDYLDFLNPNDDKTNKKFYEAIKVFQFSMGMEKPDSIISPLGPTLIALNKKPEDYRIEIREILIKNTPRNGKFLSEGSERNIKRRQQINDTALSFDGDDSWGINKKKDEFIIGTLKCNKFVYDVLLKVGLTVSITVNGKKRPLQAREWANKDYAIKNWRVLGSDEKPMAGDVAAFKSTGGGTKYSGHVGFIIQRANENDLSNISAHDSIVSSKKGQFKSESGLIFRRYIGE